MLRRAIARAPARRCPLAGFPFAFAFALILAGALRCASSSAPGAGETNGLVDVNKIDPSIQVDLRDTDSRLARRPASSGSAYVDRRTADALVRANAVLVREKGYQLLVIGAYRPGRSGRATGGDSSGRGCTVEVSLFDPADRIEADMSAESAARAPRIAIRDPSEAETNRAFRRRILREAMESAGFEADPTRWSRFTLRPCRS